MRFGVGMKFARDSPLEEPGFEPLVPLKGFGLLCGEKRDREGT